MKKIRLNIAIIAISVCMTCGAAHAMFVDNFESYGNPGDAFPTAAAKSNGWYAGVSGTSEVRLSGSGGTSPSNVLGSPFGDAGSVCAYTYRPNGQPQANLVNYFADNEALGVTGSVGYNLTGSGIGFQWDGYFTHSHNPTWRLYDSAGNVAVELMIRFNRYLRINGTDIEEIFVGETAGVYNWVQFKVANIDIDNGTFDLDLLRWINGESPVSLYSQTGVSFQNNVTDLAQWWSYNNAGTATCRTYTDNFIITPEPATLALLGIGGLLIRKRK